MVGTLISHARKRGTFKNESGKEYKYDNIVFYVATPLETYNKNGCELSGFPVSMIEVKIPAGKFKAMCNLTSYDDDTLSDHHGESVAVYYDIAVYNGEQRPVLSRVEF